MSFIANISHHFSKRDNSIIFFSFAYPYLFLFFSTFFRSLCSFFLVIFLNYWKIVIVIHYFCHVVVKIVVYPWNLRDDFTKDTLIRLVCSLIMHVEKDATRWWWYNNGHTRIEMVPAIVAWKSSTCESLSFFLLFPVSIIIHKKVDHN